MPDAEWYYAEDGEQQGPVSLEEMRRLVGSKRVQSDDLVWCEGMEDWLPAGDVPDLIVEVKKPKPVRKASTSETRPEEPKPASEGPKPVSSERKKARSEAPPVQVPPEEESFPDLGNLEEESEEEAEQDEVDELAEAIFARPKFPTRRPRSYERETYREVEREPEIIREVTREVVVMENADGQLTAGALFLQLICWMLCGIAVLVAAIVCAVRWFSVGIDSSSTLLLGVAVGSYVLGRSAQRCLEILAAMKIK